MPPVSGGMGIALGAQSCRNDLSAPTRCSAVTCQRRAGEPGWARSFPAKEGGWAWEIACYDFGSSNALDAHRVTCF